MLSFVRKQNIKYIVLIVLTSVLVLGLSVIYNGYTLKKENKGSRFREITAKDAYDSLKIKSLENNLIIVDLRTPGEFEEEHIKGAASLNYFDKVFNDKLASLDKNKSYYIYCKAGRVSSKVINKMKNEGFREAHAISGGLKEWKSQNLPLTF